MEKAFVEFRKRAQAKIPIEGVVLIEVEVKLLLAGFHPRHILEPVAETEGAIVMKIVSQEHIRRRSLFAGGLQRRMRIDQRHGGQPAAVGDSQDSSAAVVVGTLWSSHSMVSYVSVPSSIESGLRGSRTGRSILNRPSDWYRPRIS